MTIWPKSPAPETTSFAEAISHAQRWSSLWAWRPVEPLVEEVAYRDPVEAFAPFASDRHAVLLDSAMTEEGLGRFSYVAPEPFLTLASRDGVVDCDGEPGPGDPFAVLRTRLAGFAIEPVPDLPPFQGGAVGCFGYELARHLERLPVAPRDDMGFPDLALGFHDVVIAFDHAQRRAWIVSSGLPETEPAARRRRAAARLRRIAARLAAAAPLPPPPEPLGPVAIESNFTRPAYEAAVQRVIDYILAGDIFQANLSQRFAATLPQGLDAFGLYRRLRALNPAAFAAFLRFGDVTIASASPERFLRLDGARVETRPIKGTRPRGRTPAEDAALAAQLAASEKDRAENVMIVDLLRNDLSRVCCDGSVEVPALCALQTLPTVFHLVSTVTGTLRPGLGPVDLLAACFPGGSITGAPKIRAMEIIAELEPTRRGPYCGAIGWIGFDGGMDTSITIRTYALSGQRVTFQAGGGIVADSNPAEEYDETMAKARALIAALSGGVA
ncbi:MAG: aminodeoxychorismate synthase, component I [Rhodospirillaceae bacterium]|nr:aminodeoxychorismate synthase, component I [Rhodospirillaceae bacterium]